MATTKGTDGVVKLIATGGTAAAVGEVRSYSVDQTADTIEDTVMGDLAKTYLNSLTDATLSLDVYWDDADTIQQATMIVGVTVDWEIYPEGTGSGARYYEGTGVITSETTSASHDGLVESSYAIQNSGHVLLGTVS